MSVSSPEPIALRTESCPNLDEFLYPRIDRQHHRLPAITHCQCGVVGGRIALRLVPE
jgi:hypothetical protein